MTATSSPLTDRTSATREIASTLVEDIVALTAAITEVPAPTNDEADRARFVAETFRAHGYADVTV
ncbi:MAG: hypothetical protein WBA46_02350, partial [Thermomicrobiales bacterium]